MKSGGMHNGGNLHADHKTDKRWKKCVYVAGERQGKINKCKTSRKCDNNRVGFTEHKIGKDLAGWKTIQLLVVLKRIEKK